jgi:prepilin-type processing-associated H-X9-DG protein
MASTSWSSLQDFSRNYLWNEAVSGKRLAGLPNPAGTWLMMDLAAAHEWLVVNRYAGHRGGVNVLYADGHVALDSPADVLKNAFD